MNTQPNELAKSTSHLPGELFVPEEGSGPALLLLCDRAYDAEWIRQTGRLMAEEGYVTLALDTQRLAAALEQAPEAALKMMDQAVRMLADRPEVDGPMGVLGYGEGATAGYGLAARGAAVHCAILYSPTPLRQSAGYAASAVPVLVHCGETELADPSGATLLASLQSDPNVTLARYPGARAGFACEASGDYLRPAAMMAYSRSIAVLRKCLGPKIDLETLWDTHLSYEFGTRDPDATINTMVEDCYVNHIPNMTGGVGREYLYRFYKYHFIPRTPDVELIPVSRTVGADRVVDEFISVFTHDREIDWFLPGIAPTGKRIEIACVSIVCFRGRKLYHEHIYWDQASVFVQLGLLDPQKLPVAGRESALKVLDKYRPSNELMPSWKNSEGLK